MDWPIWLAALGVVFSLGFHIGHRLGLQEGWFRALASSDEQQPGVG